MLHHTVVFPVVAPTAALFGFGGFVAQATGNAKILLVVFLTLAAGRHGWSGGAALCQGRAPRVVESSPD